ncbi:hypothetical protein CFP65_6486 [Kitasatospora sp. MMS16-BH015]|uniref:S24/S26 family peptidase n=1 Tax=Kitasatospora sp. MMS16-BH015 TaxID=2018025 RepID=UPI000CA34662|nr:S24/S26 family peptidase [Kitasatospora sp. MMS16-BH015]AUG81141.1 hypothetical protein CFP65_6486 [Kitasatospora sp. MMS16-BH015]
MTEASAEVALLRRALASVGRAKVRTTGRSMLPAIAPGTVVTLVARPFGEVVPGDVVMAVLGGRLIAHRVVRATGAALLTLGDNLPLLDPPVGPEQYLGVVPECHGPVPVRTADLAAFPVHGRGVTLIRTPGPATPPRRPGRPVIAVTPYGALPAGELDALLGAAGSRDLDLLVGYAFGYAGSGARMLPPSAADFHIGYGSPLDPPSPERTLAFVEERVRAARTAAGVGA